MRAETNADGWGLAWYPDHSLAFVKEPLSWRASEYARFVEHYDAIRSTIYVAHVRKATVGTLTYANTHPFHRELGGREYCFVHNGTIADATSLPLACYRPLGMTDSEHVFCHLLRQIHRRRRHLDTPEDWRWFHGMLMTINRHGTLNCMLSDGVVLLCYHDAAGWKGLRMRRIGVRDGRTRHLGDSSLDVALDGGEESHGIVIATQELDDRPWRPLECGELLVLHAGRIAYSSHRAHHHRPLPVPHPEDADEGSARKAPHADATT